MCLIFSNIKITFDFKQNSCQIKKKTDFYTSKMVLEKIFREKVLAKK